MDSNDFSMYESLQIRAIPFPQPKEYGGGWWCVSWNVEFTPREVLRGLRLPAPVGDMGDVALIVAVLPRDPGRITVEVLSRHERLFGEEVAYASMVMQSLRDLYQEIIIDGYNDHPILHMS